MSLLAFFVRRLLWTIPLVLVVMLATFALMRGSGGDPFNPLEGFAPLPTPLQEQLRDYYNLDSPWIVEFGTYVRNVATLDFGPSLVLRGVTVDDVIAQSFPITLELIAFAAALALPIGIALGLLAALRRNSVSDLLATSTASVLLVIPVFFVAYGTTAALAAPKVDAVMMRIVDGLFALPRLPIAIVILVAVRLQGQNVETVALALAVVGWMLTARLVRGQVMSLVTRDFVTAARSLGGSNTHIALRHLIPNSAGILLVAILLELPTVVVGEAFFAVLGLGPDPPTATWGNIAQEGLHFDRLWQMALATAAIATFALSANVLVDRLGDWPDPRRRTR